MAAESKSPTDADDHVVGMDVCACARSSKSSRLTASHGGVLRLARVGIVRRRMRSLSDFAAGDGGRVVVAAGDGFFKLALRPVSILSARNSGSRRRSRTTLKTSSKSALRQDQRNRGGIAVAVGFHFGGVGFEVVVHLIAGLRLCAAGAPDFAINIEHADLFAGVSCARRRECGWYHQSTAVRDLPEERSPCRWEAGSAWARRDGKRQLAGSESAASLWLARAPDETNPAGESQKNRGQEKKRASGVVSLRTSFAAGRRQVWWFRLMPTVRLFSDKSLVGDAADVGLCDLVDPVYGLGTTRASRR